LLRSLFFETQAYLERGKTKSSRHDLVQEAQDNLRHALQDWSEEELKQVFSLHYPEYWLRTDPEKQIAHAHLLRRAKGEGANFLTSFTTDEFTAVTDFTIYALNHPRLLSLFAGACAANGGNIVGAHIATTRDGFAIDSFILQRAFPTDEDEERRARQIGETIAGVLKGERQLHDMLAKRRKKQARADAFTVEPEVTIDNDLSDQFSVIEVTGLDRPGLLYGLTSALSNLSLDINSAHITTFGEKAVDAFYVTDLFGKKLSGDERRAKVEEALLEVLDS
jgi:[protein-PII] uridylyltransferase